MADIPGDHYWLNGEHFDVEAGDRILSLAEQQSRAVHMLEVCTTAEGQKALVRIIEGIQEVFSLEVREQAQDYNKRYLAAQPKATLGLVKG